MKKEIKLVGSIFLVALFLLSWMPLTVLAQDAPGLPAGISEVPGAAQIEQGQQTYEQYTTAENKSAYLAQQWGGLIGKTRIIGPIHNLFASNQLLFKVLFNYPYEISFAFFFVLFIWFVFLFKATRILKSMELLNKSFALPIVLVFTILVAQLGLFNLVVNGIINIMFLSDAWWVRLILFILICTVVVALAIFSNYLAKYLKAQAELKKQKGLEQTSKEFKAFAGGVREGRAIARV